MLRSEETCGPDRKRKKKNQKTPNAMQETQVIKLKVVSDASREIATGMTIPERTGQFSKMPRPFDSLKDRLLKSRREKAEENGEECVVMLK